MGHFYTPVKGIGKDRREAQEDAVHGFLREEGNRHDVREILKAKMIRRLPPWKFVPIRRGGVTIYSSEPDANAPQGEWLEEWSFELHTHA